MILNTLKHRFREGFPQLYNRLQRLRWMPHRYVDKVTNSDYNFHEWRARLTRFHRERLRVESEVGYYPNLRDPKTFNEKILWKKAYVRDPLLTLTADKYAVRDYIRDKLGQQQARQLLVSLLHVVSSPDDLSLDALTPPYVIKTNHGSGFNLFVKDRNSEGQFLISYEDTEPQLWTESQIKSQLRKWLSTTYGFRSHQWAYIDINKKVLVEQFIEDRIGCKLTSIKAWCFNGEPSHLNIVCSIDGTPSISFVTLDFDIIDGKYCGYPTVPSTIIRDISIRLDSSTLSDYSKKLSEPFSFCRVDFYLSGRSLLFSEITHYPHNGAIYFEGCDQDLDAEFGKQWTLP